MNPGLRSLCIHGAASSLGVTLMLGGLMAGFAQPAQLPPLTTVPGSPRLPGKFVWADLVTDDVAAARKFYANLFGWRFLGLGDYAIATNDERPLAGIFQRPVPPDKPEAKPRWFGYISVPDVSKAQARVTKGGGRVLADPKKMAKRGEQAVFADPEGAVFGVLKSSSGDPEDFLAEPGDWIWMQLLSHDGQKAANFYSQVAGFEVIENQTQNALSDYVLVSKGYARATVRTIRDANKNVRPSWIPFVRVKSIGDCVTRTTQLGGKVVLAPNEKFFDGKLAIIADPTGASVGVIEFNPEALKKAVSR